MNPYKHCLQFRDFHHSLLSELGGATSSLILWGTLKWFVYRAVPSEPPSLIIVSYPALNSSDAILQPSVPINKPEQSSFHHFFASFLCSQNPYLCKGFGFAFTENHSYMKSYLSVNKYYRAHLCTRTDKNTVCGWKFCSEPHKVLKFLMLSPKLLLCSHIH